MEWIKIMYMYVEKERGDGWGKKGRESHNIKKKKQPSTSTYLRPTIICVD